MLILLNRLVAFIAVFCVAWLYAAVDRPVEALSAREMPPNVTGLSMASMFYLCRTEAIEIP